MFTVDWDASQQFPTEARLAHKVRITTASGTADCWDVAIGAGHNTRTGLGQNGRHCNRDGLHHLLLGPKES